MTDGDDAGLLEGYQQAIADLTASLEDDEKLALLVWSVSSGGPITAERFVGLFVVARELVRRYSEGDADTARQILHEIAAHPPE